MELEFRGWDTANGIMLNCDTLMFCEVGIRFWDGCTTSAWAKVNKHFEDRIVSTVILEPYTGKEDTNGNKIYVGDIVIGHQYPFTQMSGMGTGYNYVGVVEWCDEALTYYVRLVPVSNRVRGAAIGDRLSSYDRLTIIGNIHENPELLEVVELTPQEGE